ncbi:alpha/beta fold hydrolase [Micromonospora polyrhachis]|uniref:Pimeloyl-ACP methyl ester carboxylesterase n=1 Tax=Micromonospora polyrhachis TaxID=1282883 RepID=A0A7W7SMR2_9ACTN|nr:alpha/beta fold hydrolase [Micromonospora polyrhachis]MBB4957609.1 pimeloyl-ACP methyl ester carboxylesterase [Micromonospora polyrhachis]
MAIEEAASAPTAEPGSETIVASGSLQLWTQQFGDPVHPTVLLIMGTSTQGIGWPDELVTRLVNGGRHVIRFDHRDTGRSDGVDFATHPYALADLAADSLAVLDGHGVAAAHIVGASLGGAIGQWLAVHHPARIRTLTTMMTSPMGNNPGPAWLRAMSGQPADPDELPPPSARFFDFLKTSAGRPRTTREEHIEAGVQTWRMLNGDVLPFAEQAVRWFVEISYDRARDPAAANHDLAGRQMTADRLASLSSITAPTLVVHGTADPLFPLAHGEALAGQIPGARLQVVTGMGHSLWSPGLPQQIADLILTHTA